MLQACIRRWLIALVALSSSAASADKLSDFKDAVNQVGCDSIPYGDLRSNCRSQQSDVHPWCDGSRGPITCDGGTRDLQSRLNREQVAIDGLKDKRRDLGDKLSHAADESEKARLTAEIDAIGKEIEASKRRLEDLKSDLVKRKDFIEKVIYTLGKCIDYRRAVMNVFAYATDKVRGENDPDIKAYADTLRNMYPEQISGHEKQITDKTNAVENCKNERP